MFLGAQGGETPLHKAADGFSGAFKVAQLLLERGADINATRKVRASLAQQACSASMGRGALSSGTAMCGLLTLLNAMMRRTAARLFMLQHHVT